jgi:hypothetical protein
MLDAWNIRFVRQELLNQMVCDKQCRLTRLPNLTPLTTRHRVLPLLLLHSAEFKYINTYTHLDYQMQLRVGAMYSQKY